jgi:hypothetical protein
MQQGYRAKSETARLVRPGGVVSFQEVSWTPQLALGARLPMWSKVLSSVHEIFLHSGVHTEMGLALHDAFQEAGLPAPAMHMEIPLGSDADFPRLWAKGLCSLFRAGPFRKRSGTLCFHGALGL